MGRRLKKLRRNKRNKRMNHAARGAKTKIQVDKKNVDKMKIRK